MDIEVIILAAGLGTRMKSNLPKVLHEICGEPILALLLTEVQQAVTESRLNAIFNIVIGHEKEQVKRVVDELVSTKRILAPTYFTVQAEQKGTGHALTLAMEEGFSKYQNIIVLNGDLPLLQRNTFIEFLKTHEKEKSEASLVSTVLPSGEAYGRILRKGKKFTSVVEAKDATSAQKKIREINGGIYCFSRKFLEKNLEKLGTQNRSKEFYLPDLFSLAHKEKRKTLAFCASDPSTVYGVNTQKELSEVQSLLYKRIAMHWLNQGICIEDICHTFIGPRVNLSSGCRIQPFSFLLGKTLLENDVKIGPFCELKNVVVGSGTLIRSHVVAADTEIGKKCSLGPMAHFRPGTKLGSGVRVGNFVEIKESKIGDDTNAAHLSYIGDAQIGKGVNVGCGFVTCNYDGQVKNGKRKHQAIIKDKVFIGSDCQVVAPIEIEEGTYIASGSTVTESVLEKESLVIARSKQVTKPGYAKKYRSK